VPDPGEARPDRIRPREQPVGQIAQRRLTEDGVEAGRSRRPFDQPSLLRTHGVGEPGLERVGVDGEGERPRRAATERGRVKRVDATREADARRPLRKRCRRQRARGLERDLVEVRIHRPVKPLDRADAVEQIPFDPPLDPQVLSVAHRDQQAERQHAGCIVGMVGRVLRRHRDDDLMVVEPVATDSGGPGDAASGRFSAQPVDDHGRSNTTVSRGSSPVAQRSLYASSPRSHR
jgi:hypothetical protein